MVFPQLPCFQRYKASVGGSQRPIKEEERDGSHLRHAHRTPLSVRRSCSLNKCPHPAVSHCGCGEKVSDNLTGEMRHLHQIINTLTDRRQSVLGEPSSAPNISCRVQTCTFISASRPRTFSTRFPVDGIGTNQKRLKNMHGGCLRKTCK